MRKDLERRLDALEEGSGPLIDDLADFVRWEAAGCPDGWRWDPKFERQILELAEKANEESDTI
jgi:hypothetical protein